MKKIFIFYLLILFANNFYGMKRANTDNLTYNLDNLQSSSFSPFESLPQEIQLAIAHLSEIEDWNTYAGVNKAFNNLVNNMDNHTHYMNIVSKRNKYPYYLFSYLISTKTSINYNQINMSYLAVLVNKKTSTDIPAIDPAYSFSEGNSWLHLAAKNGSLSTLENIVTKVKPNFNYQNSLGQTALMVASTSEILNYLASRTDLELKDNEGLTALFRAVRTNEVEKVTILLEKGANRAVTVKTAALKLINAAPDTPTHYFEWPLLQEALFTGNPDILKALGYNPHH